MPARAHFLSTTPVFVVADLQRALRFYREVLGFGEPSVWGEPPCFAMLHRDGFELMLSLGEQGHGRPDRQGGVFDAYVRVDDADREAAAVVAAGGSLAKGPTDTFYRMREIEVLDPDGHRWCFAHDLTRRVESFAGVLDVGPAKLRLVLRITTDADGNATARLDSPDQNVSNLVVDRLQRTDAGMEFALTAIGAAFTGTFDESGDTVSGTWKQGGRAWPLVMARQ